MKFNDLPINPEIVKALNALEITHPTEIQSKVIPTLLENTQQDIHGQAQTGTGKTLAFGIPLVHHINRDSSDVQALIVAPTRELALQICQSLKAIAEPLGISMAPIYGGVSITDQFRALKKGVHIIVGTPGRLNDHLKRGSLSLRNLKTLVLDEADIMLDMGFKEEVDEILTYAPKERQIWLFSATVKRGISDLIRNHMRSNTITVKASSEQKSNIKVSQQFAVVSRSDRPVALTRFIDAAADFYGFVFCQTKVLTEEIAEYLIRAGYPAHALHGDMTQIQRTRIIRQFKNKEFVILVATDVAARGIDIADLTHVVNYSLPEDQESYVHRIGRTGRAGKEGTSITFVSRNEVREIRALERKFGATISAIDVPTYAEISKTHLAQAKTYLESTQATENGQFHEALTTLLDGYDVHMLSRVTATLLHEKFFKQKSNQDAVTFTPVNKLDLTSLGNNEQGQSEVVLYQGLDDGTTREEVEEWLKKYVTSLADEVLNVRVIKRRTFIKLSPEQAEQVVRDLRGKKMNGKRVRVSVSVDYDYDSRKKHGSSSGRSGGFGGRSSRGGSNGRYSRPSRRPSA